MFRTATILSALAGAMFASAALAQPAGGKLTVIYPFAAGGAADAAGRLVAEEIAKRLNMTLVYENRGGGGGRIGLRAVLTSPADGSVLAFSPMGPMAIQPSFHPNMGFDPLKDFRAVSMVASFDLALSASPSVPAANLAEAVKWMQANKDKATAGVPGAGGLPHFFTFMLGAAAKTEIKPIVYRGSGPAIADVVAGHLPFAMLPTTEAQEQHIGKKLRLLARSGATRSPALPYVPTFKEAGFDILGEGWYAIFAPGKTPDAVVERISKAAQEALAQTSVKSKIEQMGFTPFGTTPAGMARIHRDTYERWRPAVVASGFKPGAK